MSRRFGRNQRRRTREEQARLSADLKRVSDTLAFASKTAIERGHRVHALTCEIQAAKDLLPTRHRAVPARGDGGWRRDCVYVSPQTRYDLSVSDGSAQYTARRFEHVTLDMLLTDAVVDQLGRHLHARVQFAGVELVYGISLDARRAMSQHHLVERRTAELTRQFAPALAKLLESKG